MPDLVWDLTTRKKKTHIWGKFSGNMTFTLWKLWNW